MIRVLCLLCLAFFPSNVLAEKIKVISGEHADFSRIVVQFGSQTDWIFGRVEGGYELRSSLTDSNFDLSEVFKFIPKTRVEMIDSNSPGSLFLKVSCKCSADAFELRKGRIVMDIKSSAPLAESPYERLLPELADSYILDTNIFGSTRTHAKQTPVKNQSVERKIGKMNRSRVSLEKIIVKKLTSGTLALATIRSAQELISKSGTYWVKFADHVNYITSKRMDLSATTSADDNFLKVSGLANILTGHKLENPEEHVSLLGGTGFQKPNMNDGKPTNVAQQALLRQLQRAAAQGLIIVTPSVIKKPLSKNDHSDRHPPEVFISTNKIEPDQKPTHMKIKTAFDNGSIQKPNVDDEGLECLPENLLAVGDWGPDAESKSPYGDLRSQLVGEFDEISPAKLTALIRRNIFLGFGAEAKTLLKSFDKEIEGKEILLELASIMDEQSLAASSILQSQLSCANTSTIWGILAHQKIPPGEKLDANTTILTFSGLPIHLRQHLGPGLMQRFLDIDDPSTAAAIGKLIERGSTVNNQKSKLVKAQLAAIGGDNDESILILSSIVKNGGPTTPVALVELIDTQLQSGNGVSEDDTLAADALAVEYRGTEIGHRLIVAVINGLLLNGKIEQAFENIEAALTSKNLEADEAEALRATTHLKNARDSSDEQFLKSAFHHKFSDSHISETSHQARFAVAKRLLDLGFSNAAKQALPKEIQPENTKHSVLLARIALSEKKPVTAKKLLQDIDNGEEKMLLAQIGEMNGEYDISAEIYREMKMPEAQISAAWRDSDWEQVALLEDSTKAGAAKIALQSSKTPEQTENQEQPIVGTFPDSDTETKRNQGRNLLLQSQNVRQVFSSLIFE